jgi:hypothetical protein
MVALASTNAGPVRLGLMASYQMTKHHRTSRATRRAKIAAPDSSLVREVIIAVR